jgi:hypothetical protein
MMLARVLLVGLVTLAASCGMLEPSVFATWGGRTIEVRGQGVSLDADRPDYAEISIGERRVKITADCLTVDGVEKPVPKFTRVLIETKPSFSVKIDGKPVFPLMDRGTAFSSVV